MSNGRLKALRDREIGQRRRSGVYALALAIAIVIVMVALAEAFHGILRAGT